MEPGSFSLGLSEALEPLALDERVRKIPSTAQMRGLFFLGLRDAVERHGLGGVAELDELLRMPRKTYGLYPVVEIVRASAIAGALLGPDAREGMRRLFRGITDFATSTWYGQVFLKYVTPDPRTAFRWLERSREYVGNYGRWRLESPNEGYAIFHMLGEYFWMDCLRGSCEGLLEVCGIRGAVEFEQDEEFDARLIIRWQPRA